MEKRPKLILAGAWLLGLVVSAVAVVAWGQNYNWHFLPFDSYRTFPLLGLLAFSLMWTHYVIGLVRDLLGVDPAKTKPYYQYTGYLVLGLLCLHPGLLIYQLYRDSGGLPPVSYEHYLAPGLGWVTILGTAALFVFLAFEFHRKFGEKSWWHYIVDASDFAMLAIVYHGLRLGSDLQQPWFRAMWWFYALTLAGVIVRKYYLRLTKKDESSR